MELRARRRLVAIVSLGVVLCAIGMGLRMFHQKPLHGNWVGYSYVNMDGKKIKDEQFGVYMIKLNQDGTYAENGNNTSGTWKRAGDKVTLVPDKFYDLTPDEHKKRFLRTDGKPSVTMTRLLQTKMKPILIHYNSSADRLIHEEPTLHYEYERTN